ncbi:hypothetical protein [uncultured Desulfobacter sp.]|uniref:hypothetical protein n=1 Tax=uncultured Desulfobacter sp. TaxID=240139 RepID=UPI002AA810AD|nr:hypothetical protein [uncultured Desulfobacter sp.]
MSEFTTYYPESGNLEPNKRVNYVHGLVLGVDEFQQEELYLLEKHRLHHRGLHGYGTVYGLALKVEDTDRGPRILVRSGMAVSPQGQEICVPKDQCAQLNLWLSHNKSEIETAFGSPPEGPISLYIVLCYTQCQTDLVPIPSGPCQSLEETTAPSRVADDFILKLTATPPEQTEDETIKSFFALLSQISVSDASPGLTQEELNDLVRYEAGLTSPPFSSPPEPYTLHPDNAQAYLRNAFGVWVTEVRPLLIAGLENCASAPQEESCVLLGQLDFEINLIGQDYKTAGTVSIDQSLRPYLYSSRFIQEVLLSRLSTATQAGITSHSSLSDLETGDDHTQYLHTDGRRSLGGNLDASNNKITNLRDATADPDALNLRTAENRFVAAMAGPYTIVAAGRFSAEGKTIGPVYNKLEVIDQSEDGEFLIFFENKYLNPDRSDDPDHTYIVRGAVEGEKPGIFQVKAFEKKGIRIISAIPGEDNKPLGFMIEVAEINKR